MALGRAGSVLLLSVAAAHLGSAADSACTPQSANCPVLKSISMDEVLLAHVAFPAKLELEWCGDIPPLSRTSQFEVSVGGTASAKEAVTLPADTSVEVAVRFQDSYADNTLEVVIKDTTGVCGQEAMTYTSYVYGKDIPLAPLLLVLIITPITREVYFSLGFGGIIGTVILQRDFWYGLLRYFDTLLPTTLQGGFSKILLFMWLLGGVGGAAIRSGGVKGMGDSAAKFIKDSFLGQAVVYLMGFAIFMDDYANTMIVGTALRAVTDRMRVSREKLSFIVDCTASPIAGVMPLSTWIAHEITQINLGLESVGWTGDSAYLLFLESIPKRFYSWFMLTFVACSVLLGRDWAFMYYAEKRARETGAVCAVSSVEERKDGDEPVKSPCSKGFTLVQSSTHAEVVVKEGIPARWYNAAFPFFALVVMFMPLLFYNGAKHNKGGVGWDAPARDIIGNADSWATLHWVGGFTLMVQILFYAVQYNKEWGGMLMKPRETIDAAANGGIMYFKGGLALMLAFAYAQTLKDLQISKWLIDGLGDTLSPAELPALCFILCAIFSMATGTSWGTMTVFMPTVIPLSNYISPGDSELMTTVISAVLGGAVWGDHCSPVSDTTILSAAASQVSLFDHTKTQLPYAAFTGIMAILLGFLPCGAGAPAGVCILLGVVLVPTFHFLLSLIPKFGGPVPIYDPQVDGITGQGLCGVVGSLKGLLGKEKASPEGGEKVASSPEGDEKAASPEGDLKAAGTADSETTASHEASV